MAISYATGAPVQTNSTLSGNTTSAISTTTTVNNITVMRLPFAAQSGIVAGMIITAPASIAGSLVLQASATAVDLDRNFIATVASGTTITAADADGVFATGGTGATVTTTGTTLGDQSRTIALTAASPTIQFIISGTFYTLANKNTYCLSPATQAGVRVDGTWNVLNTSNNLPTGQPIPSGSICLTTTTRSTVSESITGSILVRGTMNLIGAGFYCNHTFSLDTSDSTASGTGCTVNLNNATFRLGTNQAGALNAIYTDYYRGTGANQLFNFNITNSNIVDTYLKFLGVKSSSTFSGVRWFKTIPQTNTQASNLDIAIAITPLSTGTGFNFIGPTFRLAGDATTEYNTHIASGITSSNGAGRQSAIRSTIYGYEIGLQAKLGKVVDFPASRMWFEGRKLLSLSLLNPNGTNAVSVGTYLEDSFLHTGQLATTLINAASGQNTGFTDGTYSTNVTGSGGSGGVVQITVSGGRVVNAAITSAGSGYSVTNGSPIAIVVNTTNFPGVGTGTCTINVWPYQRYGSYTSTTANGCPDFSSNRVYIAEVNASGILNTTQTNSGNSGTTLNTGNPVVPNGSALTGLDLLIWACNAGYGDIANTWGSSQSLMPIDQRWSANASTAYSVNIPLRGYLYNDGSYTFTEALGGGPTQGASASVFLTTDTYATATAISETTAGTYTDITLQTPAPTRNATTTALIPSTTGMLMMTGAGASRTLDSVYAKAKRDYVQRTLNTTAGTSAKTGFGIGSFLSASGTLTNASMVLASGWNATLNNVSAGTVVKAITADNINLVTMASGANAYAVTARSNINLGDQGTAISFTETFTPSAGTGSATFTLSGLTGALIVSTSVTTGSVTLVAQSATNATNIASALQTALNADTPGYTVSGAVSTAPAVITIANNSGLSVAGGTRTWTVTFANGGGKLPATITYTSAGTSSTGAEEITGLRASAVANATITANWTVSTVTSNTFTLTEITPAGISPTATISSSGGTTVSGNDGTASTTAGSSNIILNIQGPARTSTMTTGGITFTSSLAGYVNSATTTNLTNGVTPVANTQAITQSLTAGGNYTNLPVTGTIMNTGGAFNGGAYSITATGALAYNNATDTANRSISMAGNITFTSCTLDGTLTLTPNASGRQLIFNNCVLNAGFQLVNNSLSPTIAIIYQGSTTPLPVTPAGFTVNSTYTWTLSGTGTATLTNLRTASLFLNGSNTRIDISGNAVVTAQGIQFTYVTNPSNSFTFMAFVDGFYPFYGSKPANSTATPSVNGGAGIPATQLDFTQRDNFVAADTTFITGCALSVSKTASLGSITINVPNAAYTNSVNAVSRMVMRAIMESPSVSNALHFEIANGTSFSASASGFSTVTVFAGQAIDFTNLGTYLGNYTVAGFGGLTGWTVLMRKATASNNVIALNLWNVGLEGNYQDISTSDVTTNVLFRGFSPGAQAQLTGAQLAAIGLIAGSSAKTAMLGNLNSLSSRIRQASLEIPSDNTPLT